MHSTSDYKDKVKSTYSIQYTSLKYFALWELSSNTVVYLKIIYKIYFWYILIFWLLLFDFVMIMQVINKIRSIKEVIRVLFMLATAVAVLGKFLTVKIRNQSYENFFKLMFDERFQPQSSEERKIFLESVKLNVRVRNFYRTISYSALGSFIMSQYISDTGELPVNIYTPFDMDTKWKYNVMYVYVCLSMAALCLVNVPFDTLCSSFFIHLKGQLDMLGHRLENIGRTTNCSEDFILKQLKDCIRYYNRLLRLAHDIEYLVSKPISLQIACSVFVLIANFYAMSLLSKSGELGNLIKFGIYQACMLTQIFILCYFANEVSLKSSDISFNLYSSDWYKWNKTNRKLVLLMMLRFETPIRITSINSCYSFNLAAFTSIVNSSYSYFALLKRVNS